MNICTKCQKEANPTHYVSGKALCHSCYVCQDRADAFQCPECGLYDAPSCWLGGLPRGLCFTCDYWQRKVEAMSDPAWAIRIAIIDGCFFGIDPPDKINPKRGTIRFQDGRVQDFGFLGNGSRIPEHFRERLPDNATWEV